MKVIIASLRGPTNSNRRGGAQDYVRCIFGEWTKLGHEVEIVCANESFEGGLLPEKETVDGISITRSCSSRNRYGAIMEALEKRSDSADLIVENIMGFPFMIPFRKKFRQGKKPVMAIKHHFEGLNFFNSQGFFRGMVGLALEEVFQPIVYRSTRLIGVSDATVDRLTPWWCKPRHPVAKVPPGINVDFDAIAISRSDRPTVLYFGALDTSRKRVDHLITAFRRAEKSVPNARLIIGGTGPDKEILQAMAGDSNIQFTGFMTDEEKKQHLEQSWIFASPSSSEGFGITWIEANAYGLPVIVYDLGLDTVNDTCAMIVEKNDINAVGDAMVTLLQDHSRRVEMGENGVANARRFSWKKSSRKVLALAEELTA